MKNHNARSYRPNYLTGVQDRRVKQSLLFLLIFSSLFFYQVTSTAQTVEWQLVENVNGVEFYFSISNCSQQQYLILKVKNTNPMNALVNWDLQLTKDGSPIGSIAAMEPQGLAPNSELVGDCNDPVAHLTIPIQDDVLLSQITLVATVN